MKKNIENLLATISQNKAPQNERIAIVIKTINRKHHLSRCLNSIFAHADCKFRLYIGDDGDIDEEQRAIYAALRDAGHHVQVFDKPISLTAALNHLVAAAATEPFVLRMDDDFAFCPDTRISILQSILEKVPEMGAISGEERQIRPGETWKLRAKQGFLIKKGSTLYKLNVSSDNLCYTSVGPHRVCIVGHGRNFLLIRRKVFAILGWNENLIVNGEHLEFSLRLAKNGWLLGFTPDCVHEHHEDNVPTYIYTGRDRNPAVQAKARVLRDEYGIEKIVNQKYPEIEGGPVEKLKRKFKTALLRERA